MSEQLEQRSLMVFSTTKDRRVAHTGGQGNSSEECEEYARRLVAAWNACAGIETGRLESMNVDSALSNMADLCSSNVTEREQAEARADEATRLLAEARDFIREEYESLLMSVCSTTDGKPERENVDPASVEFVEQYEALLAKLDKALS